MRKEETLRIFASYLKVRNYSDRTYTLSLAESRRFLDYVERIHSVCDTRDIREEHIHAFHQHLTSCRNTQGKPYTAVTISIKLGCVKRLFRALMAEEKLLSNPCANIRIKEPEGRTRGILNAGEISLVLNSIGLDSFREKRGRAMLELMYSSGLRFSEVQHLRQSDVDLKNGYVMVRQGKFRKDRLVPVSPAALKFMNLYEGRDSDYFFVGDHKEVVSYTSLSKMFRSALKENGFSSKNVTLHSLRHMMATHLLEAGAGVRYVQEMLGHENIESTLQYTHMLDENMKRVYKQFHPRENGLYEEVDTRYLDQIEQFCSRLQAARELRLRREAMKKERHFS